MNLFQAIILLWWLACSCNERTSCATKLTHALFLGCTVHCYWDTINCPQYILLVVSLMCYYTMQLVSLWMWSTLLGSTLGSKCIISLGNIPLSGLYFVHCIVMLTSYHLYSLCCAFRGWRGKTWKRTKWQRSWRSILYQMWCY